MDFRFTAYDPQTGDFLFRLPRPEKVQIGDTFGTRGTLELTFSALALNAKPMPTFVEIRQEATFDSGQTWAQIGPNYLRLSGSHEDTDQAGVRTVKFVSREWLLGKARVGEGDLPLIDGKRPFYQASPGEIIRTLLLEARDRGAAQGIELGRFTNSKDSSGNSWAKVATIYYSPGLPILDVLSNLVEQGMCDYRMDGNTLRLYKPETTMGRDLTTGANPVRVHGSVTEAPVNYTLEDLTTSALLIGDEGFQLEVNNPSAPDDYGRLEVTIEQGGVNQEGTARIMVDEALSRGSREIREITRTQHAEGLKFLPYRDYRVGDFVQVRDQGRWERYRVREIQAVRDGDGWTVHTIINDRLQELLLKLAKRTSGIVNGSSGSGGDGTTPTPPMNPGVEPGAPTGLLIGQQVYLDRQGIARGVISASWQPVTESTKGGTVEVGAYELWMSRNITGEAWSRVATTDGNDTSANHSPVVLSDAAGNALSYRWHVRAVAQESNRPGPWSETVTLTMTQDTTPPPEPSAPTVETDLRVITVDWDGLGEDGEQMPVDFNHIRVYFASTENMAGAEQVGYLTQAGIWTSGSMPAEQAVWVAISAVDNVGNESGKTAAQSVTPKKLVDDDSIRDELDTIDGKIADAKESAIGEAVVTAGGRSVHNKTTPPVNSPGDKRHDVWQQWTTLEEGGTLVAVWVHDGGSWVLGDLEEQYVPRINIGEGTFGELVGSRLAANSVTADKVLIGTDRNMLPNGDLSAGNASGWPSSATFSTDAPDGFAGSVEFSGTGATLLGSMGMFPVAPGDTVVFEAWLKADKSGSRMYLYIADQDGNRLGGGPAPWSNIEGSAGSNPGPINNYTVPTEWTRVSSKITIPAGVSAISMHQLYPNYSSGSAQDAVQSLAGVRLFKQVSSTLIEDGAITTDKILANAITADNIAALAIEADHISANAITADKIKAGAIDGKLITGARIRTAASGRRTELDVEGLRSYDSSGNVVLTTQTSDGSIDMRGYLRQVSNGITFEVGQNYSNAGPGIQWSDSNYYSYPPGLVYGKNADGASKYEVLLQGPGVAEGNAYLSLGDRGKWFDMRAWKGVGTDRSDWRIQADLNTDRMLIGSSSGNASYARFIRGGYGVGESRLHYNHPSNNGFAALALSDRDIWLGTRDSGGGIVGLFGVNLDGTFLNSGTRRLDMFGKLLSLQTESIWIPTLESKTTGVAIGRNSGQVVALSSARKYKILEEPIEASVEDFEDRVLSVEAKTWIDRTSADEVADSMTATANGEEPERELDACGDLRRVPGVVAEDMIDAGLDMFVGYEDGEPEYVLYDRIGPALIPIIRRLRDRVDALETRLGENNAA